MPFKINTEYCVIGAGLAGLAVQEELTKHGIQPVIIDYYRPGIGASYVPAALANPANARYARQSQDALKNMKKLKTHLLALQESGSSPLFREAGVLRPAANEEIAGEMFQNFDPKKWPENTAHWIDELEARSIIPEIPAPYGALWLPSAFTVYMDKYVKAWKQAILNSRKSILIQPKKQPQTIFEDASTRIEAGEITVNAKRVIITSGISSKDFSPLNRLPLIAVKGQMAVFETKKNLNFDASILSLGYLAPLSETQYVIGSTYEHHFKNHEIDQKGQSILMEKLENMHPHLFKMSIYTGGWTGVRTSTPNRLPIMGEHPLRENVYVLTGFGSKGLLHHLMYGKLLAEHILYHKELPKELHINRLKNFP